MSESARPRDSRGRNWWPSVVAAAAVGLAVSGGAGCDHELGPALSITVEQALAATSNNSALCCCRVRGTVRNQSAVPVHASLRWSIRTSAGETLTATAFVEGVPANGSKAYESAGFNAACNTLVTSSLNREEETIRGLWTPPPS